MFSKIKTVSYSGVLFIVLLVSLCVGVGTSQAEGLFFSVQTDNAENEFVNNQLDLNVTPGMNIEQRIKINNMEDKAVVLQPYVTITRLNEDGEIEYVPAWELEEGSFPDLPSFFSFESEVEVPANKEIEYPISIQIPEESFDGMLKGALLFINKENNQIAGGIPIQIQEGDNLPVVTSLFGDLTLEESGAQDRFIVNLENSVLNELIIDNLSYQVFDDENQLVKEDAISLELPPESQFEWIIEFPYQDDPEGTYRLVIEADTSQQENPYSLEASFRIVDQDDMKKLELLSVNQAATKNSNINWVLWIGILLALVIIAIVIWLVKVQMKKKGAKSSVKGSKSKKTTSPRPKKSTSSKKPKERPVSKEKREKRKNSEDE